MSQPLMAKIPCSRIMGFFKMVIAPAFEAIKVSLQDKATHDSSATGGHFLCRRRSHCVSDRLRHHPASVRRVAVWACVITVRGLH